MISLDHIIEEPGNETNQCDDEELNRRLQEFDDCEFRPSSGLKFKSNKGENGSDSFMQEDNLPEINTINKATILESSMKSLRSCQGNNWRTLPMESDLEKHLKMVRTNKARNMNFSKLMGPIIPGQHRSGGPIGRPKQAQGPSLFDQQKNRFGHENLYTNMESSASILQTQQNKTNHMVNQMKATLKST